MSDDKDRDIRNIAAIKAACYDRMVAIARIQGELNELQVQLRKAIDDAKETTD